MCSCWIEQNTNRGCRGEYVCSVINIPSSTLGKARTTENHFASLGKMEGNWRSTALWDRGAFSPFSLHKLYFSNCIMPVTGVSCVIHHKLQAVSLRQHPWVTACPQIHHPGGGITSREEGAARSGSRSAASAAGTAELRVKRTPAQSQVTARSICHTVMQTPPPPQKNPKNKQITY